MAASNVWFDKEPGRYSSAQVVNWTVSDQVSYFAISQGDTPASISEYIAYDTLVPPNPFIAVTQDGTGNCVYDGGFPKFYNTLAPAAGTPFASLPASYKYLWNAINWCANKAKVAAGNKKVLFLGDTTSAAAYPVKGTGIYAFQTAMTNLCSTMGFVPTFKDVSDYGGTVLNPTFAEMDAFALVVMFSTAYEVNNAKLITDAAVADFGVYRSSGNGLIFITDHGSAVQTDINQVNTPAGAGFYATANRVMKQFGAWFTGNYDRTPVNVGFLRATYGDHPLYAGMANGEDIAAGGSESKVMLSTFTKFTKAAPPAPLNFSALGRYIVQVTAKLKDGNAETFRVVFIIGEGAIIKWTQNGATEVNALDLQWAWVTDLQIVMDTVGLGTIIGSIYQNAKKIGEVSSTDAGGPKVVWYAGSSYNVQLNDGDVLRASLENPLQATATLTITRNNLKTVKGRSLAEVTRRVVAAWGISNLKKPLQSAFGVVRSLLPSGGVIPGLGTVIDSKSAAYQARVIKEFSLGNFQQPDANALIYATTAAATAAMASLVPPTPLTIFNTWPRFAADSYYASGVTPPAGSEALAWTWDGASNSPRSTTNSVGYVGLVSKEKVEQYSHTLTLSSTDADDDTIAVIVASRFAGALEHISLVVNPGGTLTSPLSLVYNYGITGQKILTTNDAIAHGTPNDGTHQWSTRTLRVSVQRRGSLINTVTSDWNGTDWVEASRMSFDMNSDPVVANLLGPQQYGYGALSQAQSAFKNIVFNGGVLWDTVTDAQTNKVYRWNGSAWAVVAGLTAASVYGTQRKLVSATNSDQFYIAVDGTVTKL